MRTDRYRRPTYTCNQIVLSIGCFVLAAPIVACMFLAVLQSIN